ncbi:MAG: DNA adenine methylase [bacterium]
MSTKPFIKWAGGKGQLLNDIRASYPTELGGTINKYAEPFIGGGAVLFDILSTYNLKEAYISDINVDLINVYKVVRDEVNQLIELLSKYQDEYIPLETDDRKIYYNTKRNIYNEIEISPDVINIEKASLFIFLNKTCFNGLYRVNSSGLFNVPIGSYKKPCICDKYNLLNVSSALQNVIIHCGSYKDCESFIDENTFIYIDPPYRPISKTSSFTSYTKFKFEDDEQIELAKFTTKIKSKNAKIMISNSDPKNTDENDNFFDDLYKEFNIKRVCATRMINSKSSARGKINELLIVN